MTTPSAYYGISLVAAKLLGLPEVPPKHGHMSTSRS